MRNYLAKAESGRGAAWPAAHGQARTRVSSGTLRRPVRGSGVSRAGRTKQHAGKGLAARAKNEGGQILHATPRLGLPWDGPRRFSHSGFVPSVRACRYSGDTLCGCPVLVLACTPTPPSRDMVVTVGRASGASTSGMFRRTHLNASGVYSNVASSQRAPRLFCC